MQISRTAAYIAVKLYGLNQKQEIARSFDAFIPTFYELLVKDLPHPMKWYHRLLKWKWLRRFFIFWEELLLPGDLMHILCRKYYMNRKVEEALNNGAEQIINLGAGFDHLGAYYSQRGIPVFELDRPAMVIHKQDFIERHGFSNANLHFVGCDVNSKRVARALREHPKFDPKKKTLFVAEGFFDYLSLLPSEHLLEDIQSLNYKNTLLTTFFSLDELNMFHNMVFRGGVSLVGESLEFKITRDEFVELLEELGFRMETEITHRDMKQDFVTKVGLTLPVLKGFYMFTFKPRA